MIGLGEGRTPLIELPRLAGEIGLARLYAKLEGCNPSGSYKDRIVARSMDIARETAAPGWIATSSGNAGMSFAAYGRRAGLPGLLCVPHSITREKLLPLLALGATVLRVDGIGDGGDTVAERQVIEAVRGAAERYGLYLGITAHRFNDAGMRGVDAISHEIVAAGLRPDVAYVPVGGGGLVSAIARGFGDAGARTAVVAAQPVGCAPVARHLSGELPEPVVDRSHSSISGLQVPSAPDGALATEFVRRSGGWGVTATDEEILRAQRALALAEGVFVEPAAACGLAGLLADVRAGRAGRGTTALLVLTGSGLKDLATIERSYDIPSTVPVEQVSERIAAWAA